MDIFKLVGSVFINTDDANKSLQKTDEKAEGLGNKLKAGIGTAGKWALGLTASAVAVGTAMVTTAKKVSDNADTIDKASQRMKIDAESYQELAHASELCGVEMSTLEKAAKKLEGTDLNLDDALNQIYALGTAEERSAKASELFGDAVAYQLTPMLNASGEEMEAMKQEARDLGAVMSNDSVKAGAQMHDSFTKIQETLTGLGNKIGLIVMPIVQKMLDWVMAHMPEIQAVVDDVISFIVQLIDELTPVIESLAPVIQGLFGFIGDLWNNNLKPILSGIVDFIAGVFTGNWERVWQGLADIVTNIFGAIVNIVKLPINAIINLLNGAIDGFNNIKIPDWVPLVGGKGLNIPHIPLLAKGGNVTDGGMAVVGEAGAELVNLPRGASVNPLTENGALIGSKETTELLNAILNELKMLNSDMYSTIVNALINGTRIDWNERELARLIKNYA